MILELETVISAPAVLKKKKINPSSRKNIMNIYNFKGK